MISVIIAGGSGTRLWPLSTPEYPKHLLALTGNKTLLRYAYERADSISSSTYVVTEASHAHHVKDQLPELPRSNIIVEPGRRGTASCILASLVTIKKQQENANEPITFLPADHYIRDTEGFKHTFAIAQKASKKNGRIVLIGVEPDYPSTGFGYIQKDGVFDDQSFIFNVNSFKEKPDYDIAKEYVKSGNFLWNAGYFVGSLNTFLGLMKKDAPLLLNEYQYLFGSKTDNEFNDRYLRLENIAIDYALMEKAKDLLVVPANFDWIDLGSYADLHKALGSDEAGNYVEGRQVEIADVENSIIRNHEDKPLAVIGLDNVAVINTPHGLLVTRKDLAQKVGEVSKRF